MQRHPATLEEQLILKAINDECMWENLPKRLQATLSVKEEWHRRIIDHCIKKRLQWNACFARRVCKEGEYYEDMMRYLRKNMALFPYHLAEYICRVMRISPFKYYCDMIFEIMKNEQPYDSMPNFSAADALRLTGIGRNEFIDIMNKCRSKKIMWKLNKSIAKELLPTQPVDFAIESAWGVCLVNFTLEEFKKLSEEEMTTIDKVCKEEVNAYILFDANIVKGLYQRGLIYFDVPVYPDDRFKVSRLEGFVSNREQSYEDPIEELLYAVFVVSSENSTVADLASTLQADLPQLQAAASFACRLGWAQKVIDPASVLRDSSIPAPSSSSFGNDDDGSNSAVNSSADGCYNQEGDIFVMENLRREAGVVHVAFVVDARLTSYLMMGSVSPGLKSHAVTLYEAGKLGNASIADLCEDLCCLAGTKFEGELQEFANHALSLRCVLECLRSGGGDSTSGISEIDIAVGRKEKKFSVDILRCESLAVLAAGTLDRMFRRDYDIVVSMTPLPYSSSLPSSSPGLIVHFGPPSYSSMTPWMRLLMYSDIQTGPLSVVLMKGQCLRLLPSPLAGCEKALLWTWDGSSPGGLGEGSPVKGGHLLHCLNSLLKHSAVLVQPLGRHDLDASGDITTVDIPLPLINADGSIARIADELGLPEHRHLNLDSLLPAIASRMELLSIGYLRLLKLYRVAEDAGGGVEFEWVPLNVHFGVPLFDPGLCGTICGRVVSSQLLRAEDSFAEHRRAMQAIRKRLHDLCGEYQAAGHAARLIYQSKNDAPRQRLLNYASGRWNPLVDPSSPVASCSPRQTLKFADRRRCKTEVLSFDGSILRSYVLAPPSHEEPPVAPATGGAEGREIVLPGVNLIFDGSHLTMFDITSCLQARQPIALIADASTTSST